MAITTTRHLLTRAWAADVDACKAAIERFPSKRKAADECRVSFFEIPADGHLHVNVTHRHQTRRAEGWIGPAVLPEGYVHNRTFGDVTSREIIRHIREMVFAAKD